MTQEIQVNGRTAARAELTVPYVGTWALTAFFEEAAKLPTEPFAARITIGSLALTGTVVRQGDLGGLTSALIVGGGGGWSRYVPPRAYLQPPGVPYATVFLDLVTDAGESFGTASSGYVEGGKHYVRPGRAASYCAADLCFGGGIRVWWVDYAGDSHFGNGRPEITVRTPFDLLGRNPAVPSLTVAAEDLRDWVPGATFVSKDLGETFVVSGLSLRYEGGNSATPFLLEVLTL